MTKYFTVQFWSDRNGVQNENEDKTMRTWHDTIIYLESVFVACDQIIIKYVGEV